MMRQILKARMDTRPSTPIRIEPVTTPRPRPEPARRYQPDPDHCPSQRVRTVRRVRRVIEP